MASHEPPCLFRLVHGSDGHSVHPIDCEGPMCPVWNTHGLLEHHMPHAPQLSNKHLPEGRQTAQERRQTGLQQGWDVSVGAVAPGHYKPLQQVPAWVQAGRQK